MGRYRVKRMWTVMGQGSRGLMNDCFSKTGEEDNICRYVSSYETGFYCQTRMLWMESVSITAWFASYLKSFRCDFGLGKRQGGGVFELDSYVCI